MQAGQPTSVQHIVWDLPFEFRIIALLAFLGTVSGIEFSIRGRDAVRWRGSILILSLGFAGALFGVVVDLTTSSISPAYFAIGKGLGWEDGLQWRACNLGLQAGASAGVLIGCVLSYANYSAKPPPLPAKWVARQALWPLTLATLLGVMLGMIAQLFSLNSLLGTYLPLVPAGDEDAYLLVWLAHSGLYLGAVIGMAVAYVKIRRARRKAQPDTSQEPV